MKKRQIQAKKTARGELFVPSDKSLCHRALLLAAIADGACEISALPHSADCMATARCLRRLGAEWSETGSVLTVSGRGKHGLRAPAETLDAENSATAARLLTGLLCGQRFPSRVTGDASLCARPMDRIAQPLSRMGAQLHTENGRCPIGIRPASLHGIRYTLPVASAQVKSAILLAGLYADSPTEITEPIPCRDHTERMLAALGVPIRRERGVIFLTPPRRIEPFSFAPIGDLSSAAPFLALGVLLGGSCVTVREVGVNPTRTGFLDALRRMGADLTVERLPDRFGEPIADITVRSSVLHGITVGGADIPRMIDELPLLAAVAAFAQGTTVVSGAKELHYKESDRIAVVCEELKKAGADITPTADGWIIRGGAPLHKAEFDSHGDHRIAMLGVLLATLLSGSVGDPDCVAVSYPDFFETWNKL